MNCLNFKAKILFLNILLIINVSTTAKKQTIPTDDIRTMQPTVLVHGGAGDVNSAAIPVKKEGIKQAARIGYEKLISNGNVMDAVLEAVSYLEMNPNFNAGRGSALTWDGNVEMDASIMNGADLSAGCVSLVHDIYNPTRLARLISERTRHRYLAGEGAMKFVHSSDILPKGALVTDAALRALQKFKQNTTNNVKEQPQQQQHQDDNDDEYDGSPGTVGAVAIDAYGNVAAATSTGGITGKLSGRIGDSPILGAGTYADNYSGAVSATGHGETIMRYNVASRILALIEHKGLAAQEATEKVLQEMTKRFNETAGAISVDSCGQLGIYFTTKHMSWAYQRDKELHFGVDHDEHEVECI